MHSFIRRTRICGSRTSYNTTTRHQSRWHNRQAGRQAGRQARFLLPSSFFLLPSLATKSTCKLTVPGRAYSLDIAAAFSNRVALVAGAAPAVRSAGARAHLFSNEPAVHHAVLEACKGATGGAAVPAAVVGGAVESAQLAGHHGDDLLDIGVEARHEGSAIVGKVLFYFGSPSKSDAA